MILVLLKWLSTDDTGIDGVPTISTDDVGIDEEVILLIGIDVVALASTDDIGIDKEAIFLLLIDEVIADITIDEAHNRLIELLLSILVLMKYR